MLKCYSDEFCLQILTSHTSLCNQWYNEVVFFMWESQVLNYFPLQKFTEPGEVELCLSPENTAVKRTPHSFIFWEQLAPKNHLLHMTEIRLAIYASLFLMTLVRFSDDSFVHLWQGRALTFPPWLEPADSAGHRLSNFTCCVSWMISSTLCPLKTSQTQR